MSSAGAIEWWWQERTVFLQQCSHFQEKTEQNKTVLNYRANGAKAAPPLSNNKYISFHCFS